MRILGFRVVGRGVGPQACRIPDIVLREYKSHSQLSGPSFGGAVGGGVGGVGAVKR